MKRTPMTKDSNTFSRRSHEKTRLESGLLDVQTSLVNELDIGMEKMAKCLCLHYLTSGK